jgi:hypothetical protein
MRFRPRAKITPFWANSELAPETKILLEWAKNQGFRVSIFAFRPHDIRNPLIKRNNKKKTLSSTALQFIAGGTLLCTLISKY